MPRINPAVDANAIPQDLRDLPRWCCWQERDKGDGKKPDRPPINVTKGFQGRHVFAKANDPATWGTFEQAMAYLREHLQGSETPSGLSLALNGDGLVGADLDHCRDPKTKTIAPWAQEIVKQLATYTEISPSGTGLRMFLRGKLPAGGRHRGNVEVYDRDKFLTVTGRKLSSHGAGDGIEDRSRELLAWHREVFGNAPHSTKEKGSNGQVVVSDPPDLDQGQLNRLFHAKPQAKRLFEGKHDKPSQSEADLALANYATAAGWTDQETAGLLVAARQNAGEPIKVADYFRRTIAKARDAKVDLGKPRSAFAADLAKRLPAATARVANTQNRKSAKGGAEGVKAIGIDEARDVFCRHLYLPDPDVVDLVLSVPAGNRLLSTDPLWLFLKGAPGSGKTELLNPLRELSRWTLLVSNLTPAAMISGYVDPNGPDPSLLPQLDGKCLVVKDFTTILAMNPMQRDEIFGILRDVYDGHAAKNFGTGRREYASSFNLLAGVTSQIEKAWHLSSLGERFLCWSMAIDHKQQTRRAMTNANHEPGIRNDLATAAAGVLAGLPDVIPEVPDTLQEKVLTLAYLLARLRTYVARDRNDVVHTRPEVEVPTRIVKQLLRLGQSLCLVRHRDCLTDAEFAVMRKVAMDSVPSARLAIFNELVRAAERKQMYAVSHYADRCRISHSPAKRHLDDMQLLGLAQTVERNRMMYYMLSPEAKHDWLDVQ